MTARRTLALCALAAAVGFGHAATTAEDGPEPTVVLETYEDGSGVEYVDGREVATYPEGTFAWECGVDGNGLCGPDQARP